MTLGNHGWSGGIYKVSAAVVARQLCDLHEAGRLSPVELDQTGFFRHYPSMSAERNDQMNRQLIDLHSRLEA